MGSSYQPGAGVSAHDAQLVRDALDQSVATGTRIALTFALGMIVLGTIVSFLIPKTTFHQQNGAGALESLEPLEPMDVDPALVRGVPLDDRQPVPGRSPGSDLITRPRWHDRPGSRR